MKILNEILLICGILLFMLSISITTIAYIKNMSLLILLGIIGLFVGVKSLKIAYRNVITNRRNWFFRHNKLTFEELEMIEDAKNLIKCVDKNIVISNFTVYKVKFLSRGWFHYDESTNELSIFIPFKRFMKYGKDLCFLAIVHEVLHSQNLKGNLILFNKEFLEGLNQLLAIWLIRNYSKKYKIPQTIYIATLRLGKGRELKAYSEYRVYNKEISMVKDILDKSNIDLREVFINYIDINPEFFKKFIPLQYFLKQKVNK